MAAQSVRSSLISCNTIQARECRRTIRQSGHDCSDYGSTCREVRRVVLFNLDQTKRSIPYIIERARDVDPINRRFVFLKPMAEIQDFRMLSISQRHQLLDWGLKDRCGDRGLCDCQSSITYADFTYTILCCCV